MVNQERLQSLIRSIESVPKAHREIMAFRGKREQEKRLQKKIEKSLEKGSFGLETQYMIWLKEAFLFRKAGEQDSSGWTLVKRSEPISDVVVDIWRSPQGKYNVSVPFTEYSGKDVTKKPIEVQSEAEVEFQCRVQRLKAQRGKRMWYPPYKHKIDIWAYLLDGQSSVPFAAIEVEVAELRKRPPSLNALHFSNFGEDVTLMRWVANTQQIQYGIVFIAINIDGKLSLSEVKESIKSCEKEMRVIKEKLFPNSKDCYVYFTTLGATKEFKPYWSPHPPTLEA